LGATQSQLTNVSNTQASASAATQTQISSLTTVDPYQAATQLTSLQTQLQASYEITASISKLSFVNYMST
jgi:flagellar hook-associated protein 3 FlgL